MNNFNDIQMVFINNIGNKLTAELATGMLQQIAKYIPIIEEVPAPPAAQPEES